MNESTSPVSHRGALVVGGDYIDAIRNDLLALGAQRVEHWSGEQTRDVRRPIPADVGVVVILCDYVSHNLARRLKQRARQLGLPTIYSRRARSDMRAQFAVVLGRPGTESAGAGREARR